MEIQSRQTEVRITLVVRLEMHDSMTVMQGRSVRAKNLIGLKSYGGRAFGENVLGTSCRVQRRSMFLAQRQVLVATQQPLITRTTLLSALMVQYTFLTCSNAAIRS
ncbi:hypothetical protein HBH56_004430 [Parastagonospora nodorum]|uniref:Uncharacterized protein n=1 Tax=Phaeosphaeria nodorum (strain SN15 / ATCC MYA-4574 / FGSC 10173) TaxID=321614 RepID=A0A7U2HW46_PHANO|nr:hypothetical protein HBH56_004430 [Parastagonospora nodorum]QRC90342.1 hypothetical protein JI435_425260 [Parastagonospora nodorum SN15]KAH3938156.1 hypothetical protein HBH54_004420 [Parastagonospora nodorum]KAH3975198.1 hypothetical protein HBH51_087180 [Parastagonospora nodorum]KAH4035560.1 hypothetical protein HBI09_088500 [Parastagonospora nodorum]